MDERTRNLLDAAKALRDAESGFEPWDQLCDAIDAFDGDGDGDGDGDSGDGRRWCPDCGGRMRLREPAPDECRCPGCGRREVL